MFSVFQKVIYRKLLSHSPYAKAKFLRTTERIAENCLIKEDSRNYFTRSLIPKLGKALPAPAHPPIQLKRWFGTCMLACTALSADLLKQLRAFHSSFLNIIIHKRHHQMDEFSMHKLHFVFCTLLAWKNLERPQSLQSRWPNPMQV